MNFVLNSVKHKFSLWISSSDYSITSRGIKVLDKQLSEVFEEQLTNVLKTNKEIIILGDFNIDYSKTNDRDFKSLRNILGLKQVIT